MLYANYLGKGYFSKAGNLWSFCICFALKRTRCKCNQHIKVQHPSEGREGGSLSHLLRAIYQVTLEHLIHVEFWGLGITTATTTSTMMMMMMMMIIIPFLPLPIAQILSLSQGTQGKSTGIKP